MGIMQSMEVEVIKDELNKEVYRFYEDKMTFRLSHYFKQTRQSKRHGWKSILFYDRFLNRNSNVKVEDVPLTDYVIQVVTEKAVSQIQVIK